MDKKEIKRKLVDWDTMKWKEEMKEKTTLTLYCKYKKKILDEKIYDNRLSSTILFNARTNMLDLNDRKRHEGKKKKGSKKNKGKTKCELCDCEYEDIYHFILRCRKLKSERNNELIRKKKEKMKKKLSVTCFSFSKEGSWRQLK